MAPRSSRSVTYKRLGRLKLLYRRPGRLRKIALVVACTLSLALLLSRGGRARSGEAVAGGWRAERPHASVRVDVHAEPRPVPVAPPTPHTVEPHPVAPTHPAGRPTTYAARVRAAANSTYSAYSEHCAGHDDWDPSTNTCRDWAGLGVTALDGADTLFLLGLRSEYESVRTFAQENLRIPSNKLKVCPFEVIIRALGGMLSAHDLTGDAVWKTRAGELGNALISAFDSPTGCPGYWADMNGGESGAGKTSTANAGSMQMEMRTLSLLTGDPRFGDAADKCEKSMVAAIPKDGLVPDFFHAKTGAYIGRYATVGGGVDSFVEMLLKTWIASGKVDGDLRTAFERAVEAIFERTVVGVNGEHVLGRAPVHSGGVKPIMEHLSCFFPGALALGALHGLGGGVTGTGKDDYMTRARRLMRTCYRMTRSNPHGLAPEEVTFTSGGMRLDGGQSHLLRPEIVESLYVLHTVTEGKEPEYREWGLTMWESIEKNATMKDGKFVPMEGVEGDLLRKGGTVESFWLGETLKYFFLLFREDGDGPAIDLTKWVFNTEAHPVKVREYRRAASSGGSAPHAAP